MDYFNEEERQKQKEFASWRDRILKPCLTILTKLSITPNHITIFSILCLVVGVLFPVVENPAFWLPTSILVFLYCVLDGLDGPLARFQNKSHQGGTLVDMAADQIGVPIIAAAAAFHWNVDPWSTVLFATFYISFITMAVYANQHGITFWKFLRIKYFFYFLYCLSALIEFEILRYATPIFAIYYGILNIHGLKQIYEYYNRQHELENQAKDKA